jgi:CheY-like chemotaxis protein
MMMSPGNNLPETNGGPGKMSERILIVDDRYENRYFLEKLLTGNGYQTVSSINGKKALDLLKSERFDAIITDILMPEIDGYALCKMVKGDPQLIQIPLIFYTASYTEKRHRDYALSLGADEYVIKPVEPDELLAILKRILQETQQKKADSKE